MIEDNGDRANMEIRSGPTWRTTGLFSISRRLFLVSSKIASVWQVQNGRTPAVPTLTRRLGGFASPNDVVLWHKIKPPLVCSKEGNMRQSIKKNSTNVHPLRLAEGDAMIMALTVWSQGHSRVDPTGSTPLEVALLGSKLTPTWRERLTPASKMTFRTFWSYDKYSQHGKLLSTTTICLKNRHL